MSEFSQPSEINEPGAVFVIRDPATLKVLSDPLRIEIMRAFREPTTVKQVSAEVDMPSTKLYYHVNQLEKHGLIRVVATNVVSGIIEKTYQVAAYSIQVDETLFTGDAEVDSEQVESLLSIVFDSSKREALRSLQAGLLTPDEQDSIGILSRGLLALTKAQALDLQTRLTELVKEFEQHSLSNDENEAETYNLTMAFYQIARSLKEDDDNGPDDSAS